MTCSRELLNIYGAGLVQSEIAMCHHWKLKPRACPKRASVQAVTVQAFPVLFLSRLQSSWKTPYKRRLHFHDPLSDEYLAFLHDLCNASVRYFFLVSFATKAVVYNAWICYGSLWIANACLTDMGSCRSVWSQRTAYLIRSHRICRKGFWDQLSCAHFALFFFHFWLVQMVQIFAELH